MNEYGLSLGGISMKFLEISNSILRKMLLTQHPLVKGCVCSMYALKKKSAQLEITNLNKKINVEIKILKLRNIAC